MSHGMREIAEAPPAVDEARRFRGSGAIGGPAKGRESQCRDGVCSHADSWADAPPMSSSQSPLSSVSACGENCARSLAPPLPTARGAAGTPYWSCPKRKRAVHGPKEKTAFGRNFARACKVAVRGSARDGACGFAGTCRRARRDAVYIWRLIPAAGVHLEPGCKIAFDQFLFPRVPLRYALPGRL